jgi:hypothetical protein
MLPVRPPCGLDWYELLRWEIKLGRFCPRVDITVSSVSGRKARMELLLLIKSGRTAEGEDERSGGLDMLPMIPASRTLVRMLNILKVRAKLPKLHMSRIERLIRG